MRRPVLFVSAFALLTSAAVAHHGWGSYDANNPITVAGAIATSKFENPHATITVQASDKIWTVTLAPTSIAHEQPRRDGKSRRRRAERVGLWIPVDGPKG